MSAIRLIFMPWKLLSLLCCQFTMNERWLTVVSLRSDCFSEVSVLLCRSRRVIPASWRSSKCSSEMKFWGSFKVHIVSHLLYTLSRDRRSLFVLPLSECEFLFLFPRREAVERCHAAEDTCGHLSFTIPRASRNSWQGWITRPARRARTSWPSR